MQNQFPQIAQKYGKERRREKRWKRLTSVLACIVVLCTISALVLPALTLSSETFCGMEDHQHSDECYEKVLACGLEESQAPETVPAHTHTEVCYEQRPVQTCTQEESAGHTHGESCRDEEGTLVCQQEESNGHAHGEECYQTESVLICGQTEGAASQSAEGHVHTDTCYEQTLTCLLEEHTHLLACYSNPDADVESVSVWERSVSGAKLTGAWGDDLAAVALTQLGCGESGDNYIVTDDGTKKGITRYGQWYGDPYGDWNAMFVYFCLNYAGIPQSAVPYGGSCTEWAAAVSGSGLYRSANGYSPIKGDIVFFDYNYDGAADHVGIVTRVSADSFQTAEGDVDDCVRQENHSVGGSGIFGYAALPTNPAVVPENTEMPSTEATAVSANAPANVLPTEEYAQTLTEEGGEVESIAPAEEKIVSPNAGEIVKLRFIPEITHEYAFYSSTTGDTYGYLYDADGEQLAYNDDGGVNSNFKITCTLNAGETYYWGAKWYSSSKTGEITVHLELGSKHIYEENEQGDLICPCGAVAPMSGTSGELTWLFDKETGTISFIGTGSMASYGSSDKAPWDCLSDKIKHVHIEEGVTTVGSCAFQNCAALETVSLPGSMRTICNNAFINCRALTEVNLSGTEVTRIEDAAFQNCYALKTVAPSIELAYIGKNAFGGCRALTEMDLSGTSLKTVGDYAFSQCTVLGSLLVPDTLTSIGRYAFDSCKSLTEMNLSGTGVTAINANTFQYCDSLRKVSLPDTLTSIGEYGFYQCSRLSEIRIPESVQSMGKSALIGCSSLEELRLEAENVTFQQPQGSTKSSFHVTVTGTVDNLSGSLLSTLTDIGCSGITFEGPGYMTAGSWQADYLPTQLQGFSQGEYFFDEQGVFYRIDSTSNTASVFYCPPGISNYTTPKELPAIDGRQLPVPVTGVETNAFRDAADLTALLFEAPESITKLSDRAFYNAVNLASINGQTDADGVLSTFTAENLKSGNMLFWQTKITDSSEKPIDGALDVEKESLKLTISTEKGSIDTTDGTYGFYTGETAKTTITVSNPNSAESEEGTVVRVYFQFDSDDGKMNYAPGTYTVVSTGGNQYTMRVVQTDMPDCYYAELERPAQGDTISIRLESSYPSPSSGGGSAIVWGDILTGKEAESLGGGILPVDEHQKMNWSTVADTFPVTKTEYSTGSSKLVGDGKGGAYISGLSYTIGMSREGTTLEGVGKDYMRYVECVDVLTLPEGATLAEDVLKSIREGTVQVVTSGSNHDSTRLQTADKRNFISITPSNPLTNYKYLENASAALDENGNLVIRWRFRNPDLNTVISDISFRYQVYDNTLLVSEPQADRTYQVHNKVTATQRFMHSGDQVRQAECDAEAKTAQGDLKVSKQSTVYSGYFGGERGYRITARNPGALPYEKMASLRDELPNALYMRPADIAAVFAEDPDHELTITIRYATLCEPEAGQTVSGIDGSSTITNPQNSGSKTEYSGMSGVDPDTAGYEASTITVAWGSDDQLQISVAGGGTFSCAPQADAIKSVLDGLALVVTERTVYTLVWDYRNADGTVKLLPGGAEIQKNVPCVNKDTFMFLKGDAQNQYSTPDSSKLVAQSAYAKPLFTIADSGQDGVLKITTNQGDVHSLTIGGDPITMTCYWNYGRTNMSYTGIYAYPNIQLSIAKDADGNGVMSLRLPDSTMAIPENGCSQLTLSTYNAANTLENKQYINTSFITPMAQSWDNTTNKGNVVKLETPFRNEELPSVRNSAPVTTSYGYVTSSSKRVTEVGNAGNTATCTDDTNYIVLENSAKQFRYTLTVDNSTPKAMDMLTLIDGLPEVGDHTAFLASDYRFSEFKVSLADDPDISVTVTDKDGNVTTLDAASYIVEYSSDTQFTTADWKGTSQWSTNRENARAIRLKLVDSTGTLFPAGSTLALNFTCRIDDPDVQPGQTAWNSFGYHYSLMNELAELEAAPLKVGVKTPSVPQLSKQVVDHSGSPCPVKQDETFRFLVYPGTALSGGYTTREEWITALGETPYEEFSVTVKQGESLSESVRMQTKKWKWTEGEKYNIVELPGSEHFAFRRFRGGSAGTYTLTYRQAQTQIVTCENISLMWSIALIKENTAHERLSGAVFALYSPNASDQLTAIPEEYTDIRIDLTLEHNGQSWYLADVRTTPADGELEWNDLSEEEYYLLEVKAPAGYNLNSPAGEILKRENEERGICSVTVVNRAGVSLPETGGMGTRLYCFGGWLLLLGAGLLYFLMKREKGGKASCW